MFQCSSASRKFLNPARGQVRAGGGCGFSALQRAENSSIGRRDMQQKRALCFSALQRAENSSIPTTPAANARYLMFQCSSASRKFLNLRERDRREFDQCVSVLFSEPKIPQFDRSADAIRPKIKFQCSSASRKFLNPKDYKDAPLTYKFQCSSASRKFLNRRRRLARAAGGLVSVLFSEPKIPQCSRSERAATYSETVSVLFSEPKIPQFRV